MAEQTPDRSGVRMVALVGGLALALLTGFGVGRMSGTEVPAGGGTAPGATPSAGQMAADGHIHGNTGTTTNPTVSDQVGGLQVSTGGYTMAPDLTAPAGTFRFRIDGPDRMPVTKFAIVHDKSLHLIAVRRDLSGYRHVHPTMAADGVWSVALPLPTPGVYRAYADFSVLTSTGSQLALTLGTDLTVPGGYQPKAIPGPARESTVDRFTVTYEGTPSVGATQPVLLRVFTNGSPVKELERYLAAYGHLVVLREGDLGYVHVHPEDQLYGGAVKFWLAAPSPGRYRMYFDFQVAGAVYTAEFTMLVA